MALRAARCLIFAMGLASGPVFAQDAETLADIRQELSVLFVEVQKLKRELSTTGSPNVAAGGDTLQRVDLLEQELTRLTAKTEALEFRVEAVVRDGTTRIGDLNFRLCELEPDCDIATIGTTPRLGGEAAAGAAPTPAPSITGSSGSSNTFELAVGEQQDFDQAKATLDSDPGRAAELFATFLETYPGGPLSEEAHFHRAEALSKIGRDRDAGLAYLASFSGAPEGPFASSALLGPGVSLGRLGQTTEACATLREVGVRFPGDSNAGEADAERARLSCS